MVRKTDAIGYDTMRLGSALAVIRYNEGFGGIRKLFQILEIKVTPYLTDAFKFLDKKRAKRSQFIRKEQGRRFTKKTTRTKSTATKIRKYGPGYSSGSYSGAQKSTPKNSELSSEDEVNLSSGSQPIGFQGLETNSCAVCNGTESNGLVGIGLGFSIEGDDVDWVQCSNCQLWYHLLCIGLELSDISGLNEWYCYDC